MGGFKNRKGREGHSSVILKAFGGGIMAKRIALSPQRFIQLRQIAVGFAKIRRLSDRFLIRGNGVAFLLLVFQDDAKVEMGKRQARVMMKGSAIPGLRFCQMSGIMMQQSQIDLCIDKTRSQADGFLIGSARLLLGILLQSNGSFKPCLRDFRWDRL